MSLDAVTHARCGGAENGVPVRRELLRGHVIWRRDDFNSVGLKIYWLLLG